MNHILTLILLLAADTNPAPSDLTVHEWGTFTSVAGKNGAAIDWDTLACTDDLPGFVHSEGYRGWKARLQGTVRMETPVIYFYSSRETTVDVKVNFPNGVMTEWYPQAKNTVFSRQKESLVKLPSNKSGIDVSLHNAADMIEWKNVRVRPGLGVDFAKEAGLSRYYAARDTDSAPITVGDQNEKFLFYSGVARFDIPLWAKKSDQQVLVENRGADDVPLVIRFQNQGGHIRFTNAGALAPGALNVPPPTIDLPASDSSFSQLVYDLESALIAQGLYPREAQAMVATWKDTWFEEGSRLIYIVPPAKVNQVLPLEIVPAPTHVARAFVGRIELAGSTCAR
jgi:hypothetical protein